MSGAPAGERRQKLIKLASAMAFVTVAAVAVLVVITQSQTEGGDTKLEGVAEVRGSLRGLPQRGMVLGEPRAPVTLVEFGDLQCTVCRAYAEDALPRLIEGPVRRGAAKLEFRNFTILGEESAAAGAAAVAAGEQGRGWSFVELFYRNQGPEGSGYVGGEFLTAIARAAGVRDIARWNRDRRGEPVLGAVAASTAEAEALGFTGTPSFAVQGPGTDGLESLGGAPSAEELESAVAAAR